MATLDIDKNGLKRIRFKALDGKRKSIRLGRLSKKEAETVCSYVSRLEIVQQVGTSPDADTLQWLARIAEWLYAKLMQVGLVAERRSATLGSFITQYIAARPAMKPNTLKNYRQTERSLVDFFGKDRLLSEITAGDCDDWKAAQEAKGNAPATIGRNVKRARQFLRAAVRKKLIAENPMQDVKAPAQVNTARAFYVSREATEKIIAACPDAEWRLIVALARYGGLRTPSETFALTWADVDWERNRIRIPSPKTACHAGRESRMLPLFPELRPHLEAVFDEAKPGTIHVIAKHRIASANLRTTLERICNRAGVELWQRAFQNMRATRETELTQEHPLHVVVAWLGNSAPIAARHYLQVTDADFDRAAKLPKLKEGAKGMGRGPEMDQPAPVQAGNAPSKKGINHGFTGVYVPTHTCTDVQVPPRGVEPLFSD